MSIPVTITGNVTREPEMKFSGKGNAWVRFSVATSSRTLNKETNKWEDKDPAFWDVVAFGKLAENITDSVEKGNRVIVMGTLKAEPYEKDGEKKTSYRVYAEEVGVSVKFKGIGKGGSAGSFASGGGAEDPWSSSVPF